MTLGKARAFLNSIPRWNSVRFAFTAARLSRKYRRRGDPKYWLLVDGYFTSPAWVMSTSIAGPAMAAALDARPIAFARQPTRRLNVRLLYRMVGMKWLRVSPNRTDADAAASVVQGLLDGYTSPWEVWATEVEGVPIGTEIIESYLRAGHAEVDIKDPSFRDIVFSVVEEFFFWRRFFDETSIAGLILSHDAYQGLGVPAKVAYSRGIQCYFPNPAGIRRSISDHDLYLSLFPNYPELFASIPDDEKSQALELGEAALRSRVSGEQDQNIPWASGSSFDASEQVGVHLGEPSVKTKIVIATHCFYDNPHAYGGMIFPDFMTWLDHLGGLSKTTDAEWFLKTHRDPLPGTNEAIEGFLDRHPQITRIDSSTSWPELAASGVTHVITCYGSVGHELPAIGVKTVSTGFNPHIAFKFCDTVMEKSDLVNYLGRFEQPPQGHIQRDLAEFYYTHYFMYNVDDFMFASYRDFERSSASRGSLEDACRFFFKSTSPKHLDRMAHLIQEYVATDSDLLTRHGFRDLDRTNKMPLNPTCTENPRR